MEGCVWMEDCNPLCGETEKYPGTESHGKRYTHPRHCIGVLAFPRQAKVSDL